MMKKILICLFLFLASVGALSYLIYQDADLKVYDVKVTRIDPSDPQYDEFRDLYNIKVTFLLQDHNFFGRRFFYFVKVDICEGKKLLKDLADKTYHGQCQYQFDIVNEKGEGLETAFFLIDNDEEFIKKLSKINGGDINFRVEYVMSVIPARVSNKVPIRVVDDQSLISAIPRDALR